MSRSHLPRVLCIGCSSPILARLRQLLKSSAVTVISAVSSDQAVAICVAEMIALAIVDCDSIPSHQWSVAQSLKMVRPALPIVLLDKKADCSKVPIGIDAVIALEAIEADLLNKIQALLKK